MQADGQVYFDDENAIPLEDWERMRDALAAEKAAEEAHRAAVAAIEEEAFARALLEWLG